MKVNMGWLALLLALLTLSGCASKKSEEVRPYATGDVLTLMEAGAFDGEMEEVDGAILAPLYGIDPATVVESAGYMAINTAQSADEVTVLVLSDVPAAQAAEDACHQRVADLLKVCRTYAPAAVPSLESAVIRRVDNTVLLAVGNPDKLPKAVEELGK